MNEQYGECRIAGQSRQARIQNLRQTPLPMKKVYVAMSADRMHPGRLDIVKTAAGLDDVGVGVLVESDMGTLPFSGFLKR